MVGAGPLLSAVTVKPSYTGGWFHNDCRCVLLCVCLGNSPQKVMPPHRFSVDFLFPQSGSRTETITSRLCEFICMRWLSSANYTGGSEEARSVRASSALRAVSCRKMWHCVSSRVGHSLGDSTRFLLSVSY